MFNSFDFFIKKVESGVATASPITAGTNVPAIAYINVDVLERPIAFPRGMASFSSKNGVIAVKNTVSCGDMFLLNYYNLFW